MLRVVFSFLKFLISGLSAIFLLQGALCLNAQEPVLIIPDYEYKICEGDTAFVIITILADGHAEYQLRYQFEGEIPLLKTQDGPEFVIIAEQTEKISILLYGRGTNTVDISGDPEIITVEAFPAPSLEFVGGGIFCDSELVEPLQIYFEGVPPFNLYYRVVEGSSGDIVYDSLIGYNEFQYSPSSEEGDYMFFAIDLADSNCMTRSPKSAQFKLIEFPDPNIQGDTSVCVGETVVYSTEPNGFDLRWPPPEGSEIDTGVGNLLSVRWIQAGLHQILVRYQDSENECISPLHSINVQVNEIPQTLYVDTSICFNYQEIFHIEIEADSSDILAWSPPFISENMFDRTFEREGIYSYTQTNSWGCSSNGTVQIENDCRVNFFVPEAFTPNGDNLNDVLELFGICSGFDFSVYSHGGTKLFELHGDEDWWLLGADWWDGTYNGNDLPNGNYYWRVVFDDFRENTFSKQGIVTILR